VGFTSPKFNCQKTKRKALTEGISLNFKTRIQGKEDESLSGGTFSPSTVKEAETYQLW